MITRVYNNVNHGDWVRCNQCSAAMLLPCGADQCPECCGCGTLSWVDDHKQEFNVNELEGNIVQTGKTLKPEQYLDSETLENEYPDYYKQLTGKQMKHTDFFARTRKIKRQEYHELYLAVKAHGGSYEWSMEDNEDYPIIAVNVNSIYPNPTDVCVTKVYIDQDDSLRLEGEDKEYGEKIIFEWDDVFAGHLSSIIDHIPCTAEVSSVRYIPSKGIVNLSQSDIKITKEDGFVWKVLMTREAIAIWKTGIFSLYRLYENDSEGEIESEEELYEAINKGISIGLEVGFIKIQ